MSNLDVGVGAMHCSNEGGTGQGRGLASGTFSRKADNLLRDRSPAGA